MAKTIHATALKEAARTATVSDVILAVFGSETSPAFNDRAAALAALEDGAALAALGFTDADTAAVEGAHQYLKCATDAVAIDGLILEYREELPSKEV